MHSDSAAKDDVAMKIVEVGFGLVLVGLGALVLYAFVLLFASRVPDWSYGLWMLVAFSGMLCIGIGIAMEKDFGRVISIPWIVFSLAGLIFGLWMVFANTSTGSPFVLRSLPESYVNAEVAITPDRIDASTQGSLTVALHNASDETLDLSKISLRVPARFWDCFVIDYSVEELPILTSIQGDGLLKLEQPRIEFKGISLGATETWSTSVPLVGNQPGDCSGAYIVSAPVRVGRSQAKINDTTQLNLSVTP